MPTVSPSLAPALSRPTPAHPRARPLAQRAPLSLATTRPHSPAALSLAPSRPLFLCQVGPGCQHLLPHPCTASLGSPSSFPHPAFTFAPMKLGTASSPTHYDRTHARHPASNCPVPGVVCHYRCHYAPH
jgi:hypothetical protein